MAARRDKRLSRADRSKLGAFYTPPDWARSIVSRALQPLMVWPDAMQCASCDPSVALTNLLVIDPACGDGEFLVATADILGALLHDAYQLEGIACDLEEARHRVIDNCLVGVDLDQGAIDAARERLGPTCELECCDSLFDWHFDTDGRPTAFVGNPPFLGGGKISGTYGVPYQKRLLAAFPSSNGGADFCTYFFLRAFQTLDLGKSVGTVSFVATNTISQGRTREAGLEFLLQREGAIIYCADRSVKWPGDANVSVSVVHLAEYRLAGLLWPEQVDERVRTFPRCKRAG